MSVRFAPLPTRLAVTIEAVEATASIELDGQYRALREGVGYLDRSGRGMLLVRGAEAAELLQGQLTNDVASLAPGEGCYAALLDRKGRMQADMRVLRLPAGELWLDTEPQAAAAVGRHLGMYKVGLDVELEDASGSRAITSLIGPSADEVSGAGALSPEHAHREIRIARRFGTGVSGAEVAAPGSAEDIEALAVATDMGVDLVSGADDAAALRDLLAAQGAVAVDEAAAEIVRVESGRPRFGKEMNERTIPAEAGINERAVSFTKGCYIGQETVARLHYKGKPNRHLRALRLAAPANEGDPVLLGDRELGVVGTAVISPAHGPIALAILRREAGPGDRVIVGESLQAEVVEPGLGGS
jgi:tRNA-modifying protein YgfZ